MPPVDPEAGARLVADHNRRVERLRRLDARGVVELRWVDREGREHFEPQVNADLWLLLPRRTALRLRKMDEDLYWVGSDDDRWWVFDMLADEPSVVARPHDTGAPGVEGLLGRIRPLALLDLMGLAPITTDRPPRFDGASGAWVVTAEGRGGPMRMHFDPETNLPVRVETLDADGTTLLASVLSRPRSVDLAGVSRAGLPRMPTKIDITDSEGSMSVKLALGRPSDDLSDQRAGQVFDLDRLITYLRPDLVDIGDG